MSEVVEIKKHIVTDHSKKEKKDTPIGTYLPFAQISPANHPIQR